MLKIAVTIEHETRKAYLVKDESGNQGWIQKRWLSADGTVSAKTFAKAVESYKGRQAFQQLAKDFANGYHAVIVARETEKALAVKAVFDLTNIERDVERLLWVPKSVCREGMVPGWILVKKIQEVKAEFPCGSGVILDSIETEESLVDYLNHAA